MKTMKRFFLKAAGISLAKAASISLAFVLAFAMAFAACDTGTSSKKPVTEDDDTDTGTRPTTPDTGTESTTYYMDSPSGYYVLTITEAASGAVSYSLAVSGTTVSSGTVTKGDSVWTFSPYGGQVFELSVISNGTNLAFIGKTITVNGNPIQIPTLYVNGYIPDSGQQQQPPPGITVRDETTLRTALDTKVGAAYKTGVYRITSVMTLEKDLVVHAGQHIVVGGITNDNGDTGQFSAGGPLFAITGTGNILNIGKWLKLESGASLSIAKGGAVNVTSGGTLYAKTGAAVGVGVNVSGRTVNIGTSGVSNLHIAGGGALHIEKTATLAVTNNPSASKVYLESATGALQPGALTLEEDAILLIEVVTAPAVNPETEATDAALEADRIIGVTGSSVIEIPATGVGIPGAPAAIGTVTVKGYDDTSIADDITAAVSDAADEATTNSTATVTTVTDTALQALLYSNTRVTYSGNTALSGIIIPPGTTLIISGDVNDQAEAIATSGTGKLEITGKVTTVSSAITQTILQSLVTASGGGTVVLNSSVNVVGALEVNQTLEIALSKTLTFDAYGTISDKSTGTIVNNGTISTAQPNIPVADLVKFLAMTGDTGGTVEVTAAPISVASGTLAIPKDTTLTLSGNAKLTVASGAKVEVAGDGVLDLEELTGEDKVTLTGTGTIEVSGTLRLPAPSASTGSVQEINWNGGTILLKYGSKAELGDAKYIGASGTHYTWTSTTDDGSTVSLNDTDIVLNGNLTVAKHTFVDGDATIQTGTLTIANTLELNSGSKLTVAREANVAVNGPDGKLDLSALYDSGSWANPVALAGEIVVAEDGTLNLSTGNLVASDLPPDIDWTKGGSLKIEHGGKLKLVGTGGPISYIDSSGALYTWDGSSGSITLAEGIMTLDGEIKANSALFTIGKSITATVTSDSVFTVATTGEYPDAFDVKGTLEILGTVTVNTILRVRDAAKVVVADGATLNIVRAGSSAEFWLDDPSSKLVVSPGGTVDVGAIGVIGDSDGAPNSDDRPGNGEKGIKVYAYTGYNLATLSGGTSTKVTDTNGTTGSPWTLTTTVDNTAAAVPKIDITLGTLTFSTPENAVVNGVAGDRTAAGAAAVEANSPAGILKAGNDTTVVFTGSDDAAGPR